MAKNQRAYSPQDIETGLTYVAMAAGNVTRAAKQLKEDGNKPIPEATLRDWKNQRHVLRYTEIVCEHERLRREATAERLDDLVQQEIEAVQATLDSYREKLEKGDMNGKDLAASLRNLKVGLGIGNQNSALLRDRPTQITRYRADLLPAVEREIARLEAETVDSTAVEEPPELTA